MILQRLRVAMPEDVLFETETDETRASVAAYLRSVADAVERGTVTLRAGDRERVVTVPPTVEFEVKLEREGPVDGPTDLSLELELEWPEGATDEEPADDTLVVE
jgi:amphi-Trp domain-containing protein